jgi:hypothetical protein
VLKKNGSKNCTLARGDHIEDIWFGKEGIGFITVRLFLFGFAYYFHCDHFLPKPLLSQNQLINGQGHEVGLNNFYKNDKSRPRRFLQP